MSQLNPRLNDIFSQYPMPEKLKRLTILFIAASIAYMIIAGSLAIMMRLIQSRTIVGAGGEMNGVFYTALTIHGQLMFFGFISMLTVGISYYFVSKFGRKNLFSFKLAVASFVLMNIGAILLITSGLMMYGGGWYNLYPLPFHPGNGGWTTFASLVYLTADTAIALGISSFTFNVIMTLFTGTISVQKLGKKDEVVDEYEVDRIENESITKWQRFVALFGANSWLPTKHRIKSPIVPIVLIGVFVNCVAQSAGNIGLFMHLYIGYESVLNPDYHANWLLAKNLWWFFGHPIVYFTLFSFIGAAYYYIPKYVNNKIPYNRWAYRPWPFYMAFTVMVYNHHIFMDMPNPDMAGFMSQFASFGVVFPSGLTLMTILLYVFRSRIRWDITSMFMLLGISGWFFGGIAGIETGWWGENVYLHNTTQVVGHIHLVILMGSVPLVFGLIYSLIPEITGKALNRSLGFVHFITLSLGGYGLAFFFTYLGYYGLIRREAEIPAKFAWAMPYMNFFALTVAFGILVFAYNLFRTLKKSNPEALASSPKAEPKNT